MNEERIVKYTADEIRKKITDGEVSQTDWARVDAMSDEDIERAMRDDPDWAEFIDIDWSKAEWVIPVAKKALSIRLDQDIVDFFQASGRGYQTHINAVLRHYMSEQKNRRSKIRAPLLCKRQPIHGCMKRRSRRICGGTYRAKHYFFVI